MKSWGNIFSCGPAVTPLEFMATKYDDSPQFCVFGNLRSYGDQATLPRGLQIDGKTLNHFIRFDKENGILEAESGVLLSDILRLIVGSGWFLHVTPGTKYVTLGGAVANNIHGKNHHTVGSFGNFVKSIEIFRSDKGNIRLSRTENAELFTATIGGNGLTGLITSVELELKKIPSEFLNVENIRFETLDDFFELSAKSLEWEYSVAWVDCMAKGPSLGRGVFSRANFAEHQSQQLFPRHYYRLTIPKFFPSYLVNKHSIRIFNALYYHKPSSGETLVTHYEPFFYPLDTLGAWNNLYGRKGFYQFQCVIPDDCALEGVRELLNKIANSGQGSFLAVLKVHGAETSPGFNNFCIPGCSLALDFKNTGHETVSLLKYLESIVYEMGGKIYLAKDSLMSPRTFKKMYPQWGKLNETKDPRLSSSLWERVTNA